jgi:hypothetical protein
VRVVERGPTGETTWRGEVEVFSLVGHRKALKAYAWSEATLRGERRFLAVLHVGGVDSAAGAVRASMLTDAQMATSVESRTDRRAAG